MTTASSFCEAWSSAQSTRCNSSVSMVNGLVIDACPLNLTGKRT